jgi:hypothetical protein
MPKRAAPIEAEAGANKKKKKGKQCEHPLCQTRPSYNLAGEKTARFCSEHAPEGMVNVVSERCEHLDCQTRPSYNLAGEKKARFCFQHAPEGMVNVRSERCEHLDCQKQPSYNLAGEKKALFCSQHAPEGMVDVRSKQCEHPLCQTHPSYNLAGEKKARFCFQHAPEGMVNVAAKRCEYLDCQTQPTYNLAGEKKARFCFQHAPEGMVNMVSKRCEHPLCQTRPSYNLAGERKARFCTEHAPEGMVDVRSKRCGTKGCTTHASNPRYEGLCLLCCIHYRPDIEVLRNYKTKETAVVEHVLAQHPEHFWATDKKVDGGCSRRRPDMVVDLFTHIVIVEVDENKHVGYNPMCDHRRVMELSQDFAHRPVVFIRFNPDAYVREDGIRVPSCWAHLQTGVMTLKKDTLENWADRLDTLSQAVAHWTANIPKRTIEMAELFYN